MKRTLPTLPILIALLFSWFLHLSVSAQDFKELWLLGDAENGNQSEFSQESGNDGGPPGSAEDQDDDFYFAGTYPDPIGAVTADEDFLNFDRALTPGDTFNRVHFNLDAVGAAGGTQLKLSMQLCCFGAAAGGESKHDLTIRFNDNEIASFDEVEADMLIEETFIASAVDAQEGENVIEIERTDGSPSAWVQFDYIRLEAGALDTDGDGMPDTYEDGFAFLDPNDASDADADEDGDTLTNVQEFVAGSDPSQEDTDGDTLTDAAEVNTHMSNPSLADTDGDSLDDAAEVNTHMSDPNNRDTDGDSLSDGAEVNEHMSSPILADTDTDGVDDATEVSLGTNPSDANDIPVLFNDLWQLGMDDGGQAEFSQEVGGSAEAPGSAEELDDDYYFAGTYPDPIGVLAADEPTANFERAVTSGNPISRLHFNLNDIQASDDAEYKFTLDLNGIGSNGEPSIHDLTLRLNGNDFFTVEGIDSERIVEATVSGAVGEAVVGENVLEIERTGQSAGSWIQFDTIKAQFRTDDTDRDRLPNGYEANFAFLNPNDASDAAMDEDADGLTNLEEFQNNTEPDVADTDSDGLSDGDEVNEALTKPRVADTDGDGLLDGAEVATHMTNPLLADTDGEGLSDGDEIAVGSNPLETDTDGDGENDNEEVLYGTDPTDADSTPLPYAELWIIGEDNDNQSEFSQEGGGAQPGPGDPAGLDDDYYFAGSYPDPINVVGEDEEWVNFERALTSGDPFSRIHFNLTEEQVSDASQMRIHFDFVQLGAVGESSIHDLVFRVNGNEVFSQTGIDVETVIQPSFLASQVGATTGENIIEIERTGQTPGSWIQFDFVRLEQREILTDDPNLRVQTRNVFGELPNASRQTVTLEITNTGQVNALNISGSEITGQDRDNYTVADLPTTVAPGEKAAFSVTFDPMGRAGGFTAFLELTSDDSGDAIVSVDLSALIPNANGLVAHYAMDDAEGSTQMLDTSGRGRHGDYRTTGTSMVQLGQPALASGTSVNFSLGDSGAAFAEVADTFDPFVDTSISLWFNPEPSAGGVNVMLSKSQQEANGDPFALAYADGAFFVFSGEQTDITVEDVAPNEPHHVVVIFGNSTDDKTLTVYLDGVEVASIGNATGFDDDATTPLIVGALSGMFGFQGVIDDIQIYNTLLTQEDVTFLNENPGDELMGEVVVDPNADSDGDGQSDADEALAGTDPNDATSVFKVASVERVDAGVVVQFSSVSANNYAIEYSETLLPDSWVEVATVAGTDALTSYTDTDAARTSGATGYYRVRIP